MVDIVPSHFVEGTLRLKDVVDEVEDDKPLADCLYNGNLFRRCLIEI